MKFTVSMLSVSKCCKFPKLVGISDNSEYLLHVLELLKSLAAFKVKVDISSLIHAPVSFYINY